jgi:catechol 2,3-dioxygenase-like lactoylglutathione lyase family enzyme
VPLEALDHYTIQCSDLEATRDFYRDVLGLKIGPRPNLGFPGYWLYCSDAPVVHLLGADSALPENRGTDIGGRTGALDHIAFRGSDPASIVERLKQRGIAFRENDVRDFGLYQVFVRDPNGIMVEMNFRITEQANKTGD